MVHDSQDPHEAPQRPHATTTPAARPGAPARPDGAPLPPVVTLDTAGISVIPPEEELLDPRKIARESLAASRNRSLWCALAGIVLVCVVSRLVDGAAGALVLAALLAVAAVVRAVVPEPAPVALAVRARPLDVAVLTGLAIAVGLLSRAVPLD